MTILAVALSAYVGFGIGEPQEPKPTVELTVEQRREILSGEKRLVEVQFDDRSVPSPLHGERCGRYFRIRPPTIDDLMPRTIFFIATSWGPHGIRASLSDVTLQLEKFVATPFASVKPVAGQWHVMLRMSPEHYLAAWRCVPPPT
jgi:hypothetical protein